MTAFFAPAPPFALPRGQVRRGLPAVFVAVGLAILATGCSGPGVAESDAYPDLNVAPPPAKMRLLTLAEQAAAEAELKAKAVRARQEAEEGE